MSKYHYTNVDPKKAWCERHAPFLHSAWRLGVAAFLEAGVTIASFLWVHWIVGAVVFGVGASVLLAIFFIRRACIARIEADERLHTTIHDIRDDVARIVDCKTDAEYKNRLDAFNKMVVQRIAAFFGRRFNDAGVGCAIRLSQTMEDGGQAYVTRARSDVFNPNREKSSVPIPLGSGLAHALREAKNLGVIIIPSIHDAIEDLLWMETPNDKYPEVKSLMACPVNCWVGGQKNMIGILTVTSDKLGKGQFISADTLPMKAMADCLGLAYSVALAYNVPKAS